MRCQAHGEQVRLCGSPGDAAPQQYPGFASSLLAGNPGWVFDAAPYHSIFLVLEFVHLGKNPDVEMDWSPGFRRHQHQGSI